ncbi:RloB domain-containing protein [Eubacterium sp. am_0171]|uniref:RloB-like protein n=1 Tax=Faecalicatena contorta TaxID=39482 RepID=A0A174J8Q3_9FIRM|nr:MULTISPECIES: RloB family protein [Clostridia]MSC83767.1 RloB domain-containing protein [Eubacterium sp. BIOML-A1]MSD06095.1 RloB domain-containing protein [Eubacterium sp. BIOML-A2]RYT22229.1 RloB domain-containing protein [Eubacterium sp. am_0171]CUO93479.1 Uncharacterised protein [[Eubacterium] contortum] [Faecalicatena contorta]
MAKRKPTNKYYFSVEGETEQWYLKWLQDLINNTEESVCKVSIDCPVKKNPLKHAKSLTVTREIKVYHFFDYESDEPNHVQGFQDAMDNMKKAEQIGKQIKYKSGYSNFTFDLWIILHMANCNASFTHRKQYITPINKAFGEKFENMDEYKHEDNFKRCLSKMNLSNVIDAIERARKIMQKNNENGYRLLEYRGYKYYKENPSLSAWEAIEKILSDCKLL